MGGTDRETDEWEEYGRALRDKLITWEERLRRLKESPGTTQPLGNRRLMNSVIALETNTVRIRAELESFERARAAGRPRKLIAIRNEIEARLRAMDREWERRPAA